MFVLLHSEEVPDDGSGLTGGIGFEQVVLEQLGARSRSRLRLFGMSQQSGLIFLTFRPENRML